MPSYQIYGVGNALVDLEYEIPESLLQELAIDKGRMTLIEEERHHQLLAHLEDRHSRPCGGGSAANTITAAAQLGSDTFYSCKVADDVAGAYFLDDLTSNGVHTNLDRDALPHGHTGKCIVMITPDAERSMNTFLGITRKIGIAELNEAAIGDSQYVYIEGYLVPETSACAAAVRAREVAKANGVRTALTLSDVNMVEHFREGLMQVIGEGIDMVFSNEEEARLMFAAESSEGCVEGLKSISHQFAMTRGSRGALLFDGAKLYDIPAKNVHAVDTTGAGDIYAGAFMHGLGCGMPFAECGEMAGYAATCLVQHMGARLTREQMKEVKRIFT